VVGLVAMLLQMTSPLAQAQDLPATRVWLTDIESGIPVNPRLISRAVGYNNQPMFAPDGSGVYFTAEQQGGQTDIARFAIQSGELDLVLSSPESEYSPTPVPGRNAISVIRVEPPDQLQRLWSLPLSDGHAQLLMQNVEPVGYHSWIDQASVAVFILGDSFTLHKATVGDQPSQFLADNIGRTLRKDPVSGNILFVSKTHEPWMIVSINTDSGLQTTVMSLFPGIEDFEADPSGRFWMGSGSKLYRSDRANAHWRLTTDLKVHGIDNITRLASSPDGSMLAIVSSP
jgi:hypothetical protein